MSPQVLRLRSCCRLRLRCPFYQIHSGAGTVPVTSSDKQAIESLEPWQNSSGNVPVGNQEDAKDIFVDDLSATLEAHRASNRAAVIRKVGASANTLPLSFSRPLLYEGGDRGSEVKETHERAKKTHERKENTWQQLWPADSVQAKERYRKTGFRGFVKSTDPLEYTGEAQWPQQPFKINQSSKNKAIQRPWLEYMKTTSEDYLERLTDEIKAYEVYMRLSPEEEAASERVISDVNSVVRNESEINSLTLLGSRSTGLATPISDFDFTLTLQKSLPGGPMLPPDSEAGVSETRSLDHDNKREARNLLNKVYRQFRSSTKFGNTEFVRFARVPIVRAQHVATGLDVQIQTMARYQASQEYTIAYLSEFPSLRSLYVILRFCLEVRDLTTPFEGGLGSYSLLMMAVTAMKHSSGKFAPDDLAGQFLHVLDFYGKADLYKVGFSANPPRVFEKQKAAWTLEERMARTADPQLSGIDGMKKYHPRKPYLLCLQDPANDLNDLGKNAYAIKHIQATFNFIREAITLAMEKRNGAPDLVTDGKKWSCLDSVVRANYRVFEVRRTKVERYADPDKVDDRDFSTRWIWQQFEKRVKRYKGID